jgi:hypothetical protein
MNIFEMNYYLFITIYLHSELINLIIVRNENFWFGKNRVILLCILEYKLIYSVHPFSTRKKKERYNEIINT